MGSGFLAVLMDRSGEKENSSEKRAAGFAPKMTNGQGSGRPFLDKENLIPELFAFYRPKDPLSEVSTVSNHRDLR
jgi:hypothetical protein